MGLETLVVLLFALFGGVCWGSSCKNLDPEVKTLFPVIGSSGGEFPLDLNSSVIKDASEWDPLGDNFINLPVEECAAKDVEKQGDFAELKYLNMEPPCEKTLAGYCGIRRYQNITLISKFLTKNYNEQYRVKVHLVDKYFGFETAVWPVCEILANYAINL